MGGSSGVAYGGAAPLCPPTCPLAATPIPNWQDDDVVCHLTDFDFLGELNVYF